MGIFGDSLEKAEAATATRPIPKSAGAQMRFLVKQHKGSTKAVAQLLGISQRTVERYVKNEIKRPRKELAARMQREVRQRWQPKVRQEARRRAARTNGITIETRARFGFTAAPGSTDDGRIRLITQHLPPAYAARLFDAQASGAGEQQLQNIAAEGLQEIYFKDHGRRADGLLVEFSDIDYVELDYS
ncbi:DNA-binding protein [Streptomyces sp. NEAU-S7GS2]|uniref:telomere-protecting terminal protein Tpg n=1 Tax=Streptomyces sp. NEAU-S7GS2 TaxID=2202000 RepID=UPI000D6F8735|nr:DNA-binding protein [Streptomyces sp. NEAU-S7GS2]AWN24848.1 DNA-binding protein [Streptomyces sp. NEAU-S7GS2]